MAVLHLDEPAVSSHASFLFLVALVFDRDFGDIAEGVVRVGEELNKVSVVVRFLTAKFVIHV